MSALHYALEALSLASAFVSGWYMHKGWIQRHPAPKTRVLLAAKVVDGKPMPDMRRRDRRAAARKAAKATR